MNPPKKLTSQQKAEQAEELSVHSQTEHQAPREFQSVEELLREDANHVAVPPAIAQRLQESIEREPAPPRSWWRRILGR